MTLSNIYNELITYAQDPTSREIITTTHTLALKQLNDHTSLLQSVAKAIDLGMGDARFLKLLHTANQKLNLYGNDFSSKMVEDAVQRVPGLTAINASVADILDHVRDQDFDLVIAHFVAAYLGLESIFNKAHELLKPNGKLSLITSISESFPKSQALRAEKLRKSPSKIKKLLDTVVKKVLEDTNTPLNYSEIKEAADNANLTILKHEQCTVHVKMDTPKELYHFVVHASWGANILNTKFMPRSAALKLVEQAISYIDFPFEDDFIAEVVLLEKKNEL